MNRRFQKSIILIKNDITKDIIKDVKQRIDEWISTVLVDRMGKNKFLQNWQACTDRISKNIKGILYTFKTYNEARIFVEFKYFSF